MSPPIRIPVRIVEIAEVTPLIKRFRFEPLDKSTLPAFSGGAHVTVEIESDNIIRRNAYSLMSSPHDLSAYEISVRRDDAGRGGSRLLHETVRIGTVLNITHPANHFPVEQRARKHLMIAGGIGITPFLPMGEQFLHTHRPFELHYAVRSLVHGPYVEEARQRFGPRVSIYPSDRGHKMSLDSLLLRQPLGTHLYVCGPSRLTDATMFTAREMGWPKSALHFERFTAPPPGKPYEVKLARSGLDVRVASHQSMLDAIEAAGVDAPYLCRGGACGQCQTAVVECDGTLQHADHYLSDAEKASGKTVMPCVSRFEGHRLVIDL